MKCSICGQDHEEDMKKQRREDKIQIIKIIIGFTVLIGGSIAVVQIANGQYTTVPLEKEVTFPVREEEMVYCFAKADPNPRKNITELDVICNMVTLPENKQDEMDVYLDNWNRQYIEIEGQEIIGPPINNAQANAEEEQVHDDEFYSDNSNSNPKIFNIDEALAGGIGGFIDFLKENNDGK